jgi:rubrerythrin
MTMEYDFNKSTVIDDEIELDLIMIKDNIRYIKEDLHDGDIEQAKKLINKIEKHIILATS